MSLCLRVHALTITAVCMRVCKSACMSRAARITVVPTAVYSRRRALPTIAQMTSPVVTAT